MAKKPSTKGSGTRTIMIPKSFREDMDRIKKELGIKTDSEVIRRAFRLLKKLGRPKLRAKLNRTERKIRAQNKKKTHARSK